MPANANTIGPPLGSVLLASTDAPRLRAWYEQLLGVVADEDGFLRLGPVGVLVDGRDDVAERAREPFRVLLNVHVDDVARLAGRVRELGGEVLVEPVLRDGIWFCTARDPDGNGFQLLQVTGAYHAARGRGVLARAHVASRLPARDLERARRWYRDVLGLEPEEERSGGLRYACADGHFTVFASVAEPSGAHTQMAFTVDDLDEAMAVLRSRGVVFEEYDLPGLRTVDGVAEIDGNYPSMGGIGERGAWFRDCEGNLLGVGQPVR
jgi:predicted enzyme related to lactoylglutathione lyase